MKNPLRGLRFSLFDFRKIHADLGVKVAFFAIALIPLVYGALYLAAFYDPYHHIQDIPVAVVNEDAGAQTQAGKSVNAGKDIVFDLKKTSDGLDWHFVGAQAAQSGLEQGNFYMKILIPRDFSQKVVSADSKSPQKAQLIMTGNESNNFLATTLAQSVMHRAESKINASLSKQYYQEIFDQLHKGSVGLDKAAAGAGAIHSGADALKKGARTLHGGLVQAQDGSYQLVYSLGEAKQGSQRLTGGLNEALEGSSSLRDGLARLSSAADLTQQGGARLSAALQRLQAEGADPLYQGLSKLKQGLDAEAPGLLQLDAGSERISQGIQTLADASESSSSALDLLAHKIQDPSQTPYFGKRPSLSAQMKALQARAAALSPKAQQSPVAQLAQDSEKIQKAAQDLKASLAQLPTTLQLVGSSLRSSASSLSDAGTNLANGVQSSKQAVAGLATGSQMLDSLRDKLAHHSLKDADLLKLKAILDQSQAQSAEALAADAKLAQNLSSSGKSVASAGTTLSLVSTQAQGLFAPKGAASELSSGLSGVKDALQNLSAQLTQVMDASQALLQDSLSTVQSSEALIAPLKGNMGGLQRLASGSLLMHQKLHELRLQLSAHAAPASAAGAVGETSSQAAVSGEASSQAGAAGELPAQAGAVRQLSFYAGLSQLERGAHELQTSLALIANKSSYLNSAEARLAGAVSQAHTGSESLHAGLLRLDGGAQKLLGGLGALEAGQGRLQSALAHLQEGGSRLLAGQNKLLLGSASLKSQLHQAAEETDKQVPAAKKAQEDKIDMMSEPAVLKDKPYTEVSNYGSGLAPYFTALGLCVGALMATFIIRPLSRRLIASGAHPAIAAFSGLIPAGVLGIIQAVILGLCLQFFLRIDLIHAGLFYITIALASLVFACLAQFLMAAFDLPGKFLYVVLLMLQLTSAAGTFPLETVPRFFRIINPYLPMTYVVRALRVATSGKNIPLLWNSLGILALFGFVFFVLTCLVAYRKRLLRLRDLHPLVNFN